MVKFSELIKQLKKERRIVRMTVVGDGAVGKTTLVRAMLQQATGKAKIPSDSNISRNKKISRTPFIEIESWEHEDVLIQCYDLAGQRNPGAHPLDIIQDQVLSLIDVYIFLFSLDRYESFENLNNWIKLASFNEDTKSGNLGFVLVGNKSDLERNVSEELIRSVVGENKQFQTYVETCAIKGIGIDK